MKRSQSSNRHFHIRLPAPLRIDSFMNRLLPGIWSCLVRWSPECSPRRSPSVITQLDNFCILQPILRRFAKAISGNSDPGGHTPPRWTSVSAMFGFLFCLTGLVRLIQSVISHITGSSLQSPSGPSPIGPKMCGGSREDIT